MAAWKLRESDMDRAEWFLWNAEIAAAASDLREAVAEFEADGAANTTAAEDVTRWFRREAVVQGACITRMLVVDGHVATFYALSSGEMSLGATENLKSMGMHVPFGPPRDWTVGASHIEVIGRDHRAPPGVGMVAIRHAISMAKYVANLQGNLALTLDPADQETQKMWRRRGFARSEREAGLGLRRLYLPLRGPYYGPIDRG
jgi:hypothetical protein